MATSYRKELDKIYRKINSIAQNGTDRVFEYFEYIDELIKEGHYPKLLDVMITKYGIDVRRFQNIQDFKRVSFPEIRKQTAPPFLTKLDALKTTKGVYQLGSDFYDKTSNQFLGMIVELEESTTEIAYKDPELRERQEQIIKINLEVTRGLSASTLANIPSFLVGITASYNISDFVTYQTGWWKCITSYTYSLVNNITPTYSTYWIRIVNPTYSVSIYSDNTVELIDKYSFAIDDIKKYLY